jgi:hypothetical protein
LQTVQVVHASQLAPPEHRAALTVIGAKKKTSSKANEDKFIQFLVVLMPWFLIGQFVQLLNSNDRRC